MASARVRTPLLVVVICLIAGCMRIPQSQLIGRWRADHDWGFEVLTLEKDGSFRQEITVREKNETTRVLTNQGTWKHSADDWTYLTLTNCLVPYELDGSLRSHMEKPYGICHWPVERDWLVSSQLRIGSVEGNPFRRLKDN